MIKSYFNPKIKAEVGYLISKMHAENQQIKSVYFTFQYLWDKNKNLETEVATNTEKYETIISDNELELKDFFAQFKPVFEHNPKHDKGEGKTRKDWEIWKKNPKGKFISQLSCYNGKEDIPKVQKILNKRYPEKFGKRFISFDSENDVFVVFFCHKGNKYHGFDEYHENNLEKIPLRVKKHFNK